MEKLERGIESMCMFCNCNETKASVTTHVVNYKGSIIVVKNVPCVECVQCGETYFSDEVARQLEKIVNVATQIMQDVSVIDYQKAA